MPRSALTRDGVPVDEHPAWGDWIDPAVVPESGTPEEIAAGVALLLSQISEEEWSAGWLMGLEYRGREWAHGATGPSGVDEPGVRETLARGAALLEGAWVAWDEGAGVVLVGAEEWAMMRDVKVGG